LFPATLKGAPLQWFKGPSRDIIQTLDEKKKFFMKKYQYYLKGRELMKEIFKIMQKEDESLEYYVE